MGGTEHHSACATALCSQRRLGMAHCVLAIAALFAALGGGSLAAPPLHIVFIVADGEAQRGCETPLHTLSCQRAHTHTHAHNTHTRRSRVERRVFPRQRGEHAHAGLSRELGGPPAALLRAQHLHALAERDPHRAVCEPHRHAARLHRVWAEVWAAAGVQIPSSASQGPKLHHPHGLSSVSLCFCPLCGLLCVLCCLS
jgi:hypothetical protein